MPSDRSVPGRVLVASLLAVLSVVGLLVVGLTGRSGPATTAITPGERVLLISVPGLQWGDLVATDTPAIDALLDGVALASVRAIGPTTSLDEGYLTVGAGYRLDDVDDPGGGEPGALGTALREAGRTTAVFGSDPAIGALMDDSGDVGRFGPPTSVDFAADVTLVELLGLERTSSAVERAEALASVDAAIAAMSWPAGTTVLLVVPIAPDERAEVVVFAVDEQGGPGTAGLVASASTRRAGYVTLPDIAPTVLEVLDVEVPDSMDGTAIRIVTGDAASRAALGEVVDGLADRSARVEFRDRAVGPVSVVFVALIALCGFAGLGRRARAARSLAPIVVAYPTVTFLAGATAYHRVPLDFLVLTIPVVAAVLASIVVAATFRFGKWVPVTVLCAALWALLVVDVVTGARLQIDTPLGYTPTIAGRFQGFGNLAFGLVAASALAVGVMPLLLGTAGDRRRFAWIFTAWIGAVTLVVVALPAFGSDVGGTLAFLPAAMLLTSAVARRRLGWRPLLIGGFVAVVGVAALALADRARPEESRTHLGRFADDLLSGRGGDLLGRKVRGNLEIMTATIWPAVLLALLVVGAVIAWRRRTALRAALADRPAVDGFLRSFGLLAVLGMLLNDSGIAVPAVMLGIAIPWLVADLLEPAVRRGRE